MLKRLTEKFKFWWHQRRGHVSYERQKEIMLPFLLANVYNRELLKFRGAFSDKDIYIIGNGPSERDFDPKNIDYENSIVVGINRAFKDARINFDFLFAQDSFPEGMKDFLDYRPGKCTKMLGIVCSNDSIRIKMSDTFQEDVLMYSLDFYQMGTFPLDISVQPFADLRGTVFSALQFALYTNPRAIKLVGFDCGNGHAFKKDNKTNFDYQLQSWMVVKQYLLSEFPMLKIISINPVGLKGLFLDEYL